MRRPLRLAVALVAALVLVNVGLRLLGSVTGGSPGGPESSSYATGADGAAAWAALLTRSGYQVEQDRRTPSRTPLAPGSTVILLSPSFVLEPDARALAAFVAAGGRLVTGGGDLSWVRALVPGGVVVADTGISLARPLAPVPEDAEVTAVRTAGEGSFTRLGGALPFLGDAHASVAAAMRLGAGRLVLLADPSVVQNAFLGLADNARFAIDIAGSRHRPVVFLESYHGYGAASGLAGLPTRWKDALALSALAALLLVAASWRRLGPPETRVREFDPARRQYVEALAGVIARTRDPGALAPLQLETRNAALRQAGLHGDASSEELLDALRRAGLDDEEARVVAAQRVASDDVVPLGRAAARIRSTLGRAE